MNAAPSHSRPDAAWRRKFRERLRTWYRRNARSLPWKETRDPYRIWISEIMLQQTQVATVIDYYPLADGQWFNIQQNDVP